MESLGCGTVRRSLIVETYTNLGNGSILIPEDECFCLPWLKSMGSNAELKAANALQWSAFAFSILLLIYYAYATWKTTCGWEEVYVCCVETAKVIIEFFHEFDEPAMLLLANGNRVQWLRYGEWLLTCPVILIHLSNLTGLKDDYNKRTMRLLVSDIGTIVWGATAAMAKDYVKVVFFLLGCLYGANTFFHAAKVYIESYHTVPKGTCRLVVRAMAWLFFLSWGMFPVLFLLGPEGFGHLSIYGSTIGHTIIDLMSKNCWGLLGHYLRLKIHEHILLHGDIRKVIKVKVAGEELEVETLVEAEDADTVKKPTSQYAHRESFLLMRDRLKEKGYNVRASLDASGTAEEAGAKPGLALSAAVGAAGTKAALGSGVGMLTAAEPDVATGSISPGRVILAVPDISMVDYFREQFALLSVPYEVVPALGADNTVQLVQQAAAVGGCDFVLMHPEFLRDKTPGGLPARMRSLGQRLAAFGWQPLGPVRDLIEESGLDGWLEGPSFGAGISLANLSALIARMQQARKLSAMGMGAMGASGAMTRQNTAMGMVGGIVMSSGGSMVAPGMFGLNGSAVPGGMMSGSMPGGGGMNSGGLAGGGSMIVGGGLMNSMNMGQSMSGMLNGTNGVNGQANSVNGMGMSSQISGPGSMSGPIMVMNGGMMGNGTAGGFPVPSAGSVRIGTNPLFNTAPSPLSSQPGDSTPAGALGGTIAPAAGALTGAAGVSEAEMLQQLMNEINRLKSELGEQH